MHMVRSSVLHLCPLKSQEAAAGNNWLLRIHVMMDAAFDIVGHNMLADWTRVCSYLWVFNEMFDDVE